MKMLLTLNNSVQIFEFAHVDASKAAIINSLVNLVTNILF